MKPLFTRFFCYETVRQQLFKFLLFGALVWYRACYVKCIVRASQWYENGCIAMANSPNLNIGGEVKGHALATRLKYLQSANDRALETFVYCNI